MTEPLSAPGWRTWTVWSVGVLAYVVAVINRSSLSAVGVDAANRFHADASTLALFAVLQLAVYGGMQIPVGLVLDRFGARPIMATGMVLMAAGQLVMAMTDSVGVGILARVLVGAGDACVFPAVLRVIATWFPAQRAPVLVQLTGILGQLGQIVAVLPLAALLHATSWTAAFGGLGGLAVLFAVLTFAVIRNRPPERRADPVDTSVDTETGAVRVVRSSPDLREGLAAAWRHPGTRLGFWSHFATPFAGTAFVLLWGFPFLTVGEGLSTAEAGGLITVLVLVSVAIGPVVGALSGRHPTRRSRWLVLPTIAVQAAVWLVVIAWPGPAPLWLLVLLMAALATGGPASLIAFDHARAFNPGHRLSTATGIINGGGFFAALLAILFIGIAMDVQRAGTPDTYSLDAFRIAFLTQLPLWAVGALGIVVNRRRTMRVLAER